MRRRVNIEFVGHNIIKITSFNYQKTFDLTELKKNYECVDLVTGKRIKFNSNVAFKLSIEDGDGKLGNPFILSVSAQTEKFKHEVIGEFDIYKGKEQLFEVDLPN